MVKVGMGATRRVRPTRRDVLRAAGLGAVAVSAFGKPAIAQQRNITFTLPWVPEGPNLITFVAKANGYWSKARLNVGTANPSGSVRAAPPHGNRHFEYVVPVVPAALH